MSRKRFKKNDELEGERGRRKRVFKRRRREIKRKGREKERKRQREES